MLRSAKISISKMKREIFIYGLISGILYIVSLLSFKYLNLLHIRTLRIFNYVALTLISLYQVHHWIKKSGGYIPFLEVFFTVLFTGAFSFAILGIFIFIYSFSDPYLTELFIVSSNDHSKLVPAIVVFFEGSGASIIVSLIVMLYASKFEEGETSLPR